MKLIPIIGSEINMQMDVVYRRLSEYIPHQRLLLNEPMKNHTSFRIGGAQIYGYPARTLRLYIR